MRLTHHRTCCKIIAQHKFTSLTVKQQHCILSRMRDVGRHLDLEERVLYLNIGVVRFWDRMRTPPPPPAPPSVLLTELKINHGVCFVCFCLILYKYLLCILNVMDVPFWVFSFIVLFCVLFVCKCVLYYCHQIATQLQLPNTSSYHQMRHLYYRRTAPCLVVSPTF